MAGYIEICYDISSGKVCYIDIICYDLKKCRAATNAVLNCLPGVTASDMTKLLQKLISSSFVDDNYFELGDFAAYYSENTDTNDEKYYSVNIYKI